MKQVDCYQLGRVIKPHGLKGEVSIFLDVTSPHEYKNMESFFLFQEGNMVPFFIENIHITSNKVLVKFEGIDSLEAATVLIKSVIYLPLSYLPKLPDGSYYFYELIGCRVFENGKMIGSIREIVDLKGNELMQVMDGEKEILIPMGPEILKKVDVKRNKVEVELPEGLLELYS